MAERMNLYFPLWIDGGLSDDLLVGARALRDYLSPRFAFEELPVDEACSPALERNILGYEAIRSHLGRAGTLLLAKAPGRLFTIGGGCGIEVPLVAYLRQRLGPMRILWFDSHGDINSPATSPSKYFHGMPLRFLLEPGLDEGIGAGAAALDPAEIALIGSRDLDPPEESYIRERGIACIGGAEAAVLDPGDRPLYIHLDLDVLDPGEYPNVKCPTAKGLGIGEVAEIIRGLAKRGRIAGMSIVENLATDAATLSRLEPIFEVAERF
jgi:arginase